MVAIVGFVKWVLSTGCGSGGTGAGGGGGGGGGSGGGGCSDESTTSSER